MAQPINIQFTRFSAFYSPLIATIAGGFLKEEGFEPMHSIAAPGKSAVASLLDGTAHVVQSAPSSGFAPLEKGEKTSVVHFAQINEKDGFFITARKPDSYPSSHRPWSKGCTTKIRCSDDEPYWSALSWSATGELSSGLRPDCCTKETLAGNIGTRTIKSCPADCLTTAKGNARQDNQAERDYPVPHVSRPSRR